MATKLWRYLINTFLVNTIGNFKKTLTLITDHLAKLQSQNSDAQILAMYNTFLPLQESFDNLYAQWQQVTGTYEGKTQGFKVRLKHFSVEQINVWRGTVFNIFPENSPTAKEIFYDDRKPFQKGTYEQRVNAFKTLGDKLAEYTTYPALVALSTEVLSAHNELKSLREAQQNKEGASAILSAGLETARVIVCQEMYSNLGLLMSKYKQDPKIVEQYFDLSLLRKTGEDDISANGTLAPNAIEAIIDYQDPGFNFPPTTVLRIRNTSTNGANLIVFPSNTETDPPGSGTQYMVPAGGSIEKTFAELGSEGFLFLCIQNINALPVDWEIEVVQ